MSRRRIQRTAEEEEEFQQRCREKRNENQRRRRQIEKEINTIKTNIFRNHIIELNNEVEEEHIAASSNDNYNIEFRNQNVENFLNIVTRKQRRAEKQINYRSRKRQQPLININSTNALKNVIEYYIGSMDVICIHCNAKHFAAEKIHNKGNSFHDCCNHGAVYLEILPQFPQFLHSLFDGGHAKSNNFFQHIFLVIIVHFHSHHLTQILKTEDQVHVASKYMGRFIIRLIQHCMLLKMKIRLMVSFLL